MEKQQFEVQMLEMYRKYEVVLQRIQVYDKLVEKVEILNSRLDEMSNSFTSKNSEILKLLSENESKIKELENVISSIDQKHSNQNLVQANRFKENMASLKDVKDAHSGLEYSVNKLHENLALHVGSAATKNEVQNISNSQQKDIESLEQELKTIGSQVARLSVKADQIVTIKSALEQSISEMSSGFTSEMSLKSDYLSDLDRRVKLVSDAVSRNKEKLEKLINDIHEEMNTKILNIPSAQELSFKMGNRLDMVEMESRNFSLRFTNQDQNIKYLEKKVENASLRLSKLEIDQKQ